MRNSNLVSKLADPTLLVEKAYVNGQWISADDGSTFDVSNPATGEVLAAVPNLSAAEVNRAIEAAYGAQKAWANLTAKARSVALRKLYDLIIGNVEDLAVILTAEMGKPFQEARTEIVNGAAYVEWFAEEAKRLNGDIIPAHQTDKRLFVLKKPVGVVGAITPWNFPSAMLARKLAPALAVGCSLVAKPAAQTPLSALALAVLAERAGIPAGILNVLTSMNAAMVGTTFCTSEFVRKISFTGSTNVGRILMRQGADQIKKVSLELGGNAPFIVFDDADIDAAVDGAIAAKFRNAGQTCVCANRIYVQSGVYQEFAEKLTERVRNLKVGDGFAHDSEIGPLIDGNALKKVNEHVEDALSRGAKVAVGGSSMEHGGQFFTPTVLVGVTSEMKVAKEETFGPLAPLFSFETEEEVVAMANNTEFGLAGYFYSRDIGRIFRVAEDLETGMVGVNTGLISSELAPFGGVKQSGLGREGSKYGTDDYVDLKYICLSV
ncbi:succinate-semialdehyde dehydrogenase (NADP(+)) [Ochrobactrum sp. MYb15]|uniref:NAD-dependent succinate-semialdehyde dehydrogenase n=1 Tax=Brucella pituitosa TaxID=571256 RepID=UPI000CFDA4C8|nr:succinate-semialdehyde dehydrogenase (NADP(+)) [Ochrobactrum sp. MYb19]PRA60599.1 succinate-semialdehyde dehydrogenase (NADP(+)) [Ochrobactrum sp. MYb18]PRA73446.1 succinate-semialdehyde dehydrogenase (NADP(+)) [Brucella thiophenivorans]PRA85443.1 succinate-semialdehyde dehydrogenase (NADP(+)) [Ochrobactrum sp. MYb14]PRA94969.1 succinate-semialdehyde dehydrogenase (NADP(+)) [Ochrobactrum sp. MYb15]